jgi:hypothetical protein
MEQAAVGGKLPDDYLLPYVKNPPRQATKAQGKTVEKADPFGG